MPPADLRPRFPSSGAPLSVLVDYDGTISRVDVGDLLLQRHVSDRQALTRLDAAYDAGTIGSRELMRWDMDALPDAPDILRAEAEAVEQDLGFGELVRSVRGHGGCVEVVSDGLGFYIESNLRRLGFDDVPVATNRNRLQDGGAGLDFPFGHPACLVCGTCKRERVRLHQEAGRVVVFVGDGPSDRYAAHHADVVFAKGSLRAWCVRAGIASTPWVDLAEVAAGLEHALAEGRLPAGPADVAAWRGARQRLGWRPFICGPEAWGEGRTVPPARDG